MDSSYRGWLETQMNLPPQPVYVNAMQAWFDRGELYRPGGDRYMPEIITDTLWKTAAEAPDSLRVRLVHGLVQIFGISFQDRDLYDHGRAFAGCMDDLGRLAFGNHREPLEAVALSPVMGMFLAHIRNQKADATSGRKPDENFAREVMQLFSIGLHELNEDGSVRLSAGGQPAETCGMHDVEGITRVHRLVPGHAGRRQPRLDLLVGQPRHRHHRRGARRPAADAHLPQVPCAGVQAVPRRHHRRLHAGAAEPAHRTRHPVQPRQRRPVLRPPADTAAGDEQSVARLRGAGGARLR